jgi:hypothetical protein
MGQSQRASSAYLTVIRILLAQYTRIVGRVHASLKIICFRSSFRIHTEEDQRGHIWSNWCSPSLDWSSLSQLREDRRIVDGLTSETDLFRRDRREWPYVSNFF